MAEAVGQEQSKSKKKTVLKVLRLSGFIALLAILVVLTVNALLCVFMKHYYPTFGKYRLFAIVSDSMEPDIMTGDMVVGRVPDPDNKQEIAVGTVITYELKQGNSIVLITHRVTAVNINSQTGEITYTTRGDNADGTDAFRPSFDDVVGIYTGNKCGFFGYVFGFLQSSEGAIALIIVALIVALTWIIIHFVNLVNVWRKIALEAMKKSGLILSDTQIDELGTIADVLNIVAKEPESKKDLLRKDKKLNWFIRTGALPRRPYNDDLNDDLERMNSQAAAQTILRLVKEGQDEDAFNRQPVEEAIAEQYKELAVEEDFSTAPEMTERTPEMTEGAEEEQWDSSPSVQNDGETSAEEEQWDSSPSAQNDGETDEEFVGEEAAEDFAEEELAASEELEVSQMSEAEKAALGITADMAFTRYTVRYNYSFRAKLALASAEVKAQYMQLENLTAGYKKVKTNISRRQERIYRGRETLAVMLFKGKKLCIAFALDLAEYAQTKYRGIDVSGVKRFEKTPMLIKLTSARKLKYAKELLALLMEKYGIEQGEPAEVISEVAYASRDELIERGEITVSGSAAPAREAAVTGEESPVVIVNEVKNPTDEAEEQLAPSPLAQNDGEASAEEESPVVILNEVKNPTDEAEEQLAPSPSAQNDGETSTEEQWDSPLAQNDGEISAEEACEEVTDGELLERDFEILEEVDAETVTEVMSDEEAKQIVEEKVVFKKPVVKKKGIVNIDSLSKNFESGEHVTLEKLRQKGLVAGEVTFVKVLAKGSINKPLIVEADDFSLEAVKMLALTGGRVIRKKSE